MSGNNTHNEECIICKSSLQYHTEDTEMECFICHKKEHSRTNCINGHYVCNECHTKGIAEIITSLHNETSKDPIAIVRKLMTMPFCHMHGPEHHTLVGAALLTAYKNSGGNVDLETAIPELHRRASQVPGGACGFWGACGAGVSTGMFISIITESTPLKEEPWGMSNKMTSCALSNIGAIGGPRCCKRDSYLAILSAVQFVKENLSIEMQVDNFKCILYNKNNQCISKRCPFYGQD